MRPPVEEAAEEFERATGNPVEIQFGGSGTLLGQIAMGKADLYLAADSHFIDLAAKRDWVSRRQQVATQVPVLVKRSEIVGLESITDLNGKRFRVGVGDPEAAAIGRFTRSALESVGVDQGFEPTATFATVFEIANALELGTIDAAIIWDNVAARYPGLVIVPTPDLSRHRSAIEIAVLKGARRPELAGRFCDFLVESLEVRSILQENGLTLPES